MKIFLALGVVSNLAFGACQTNTVQEIISDKYTKEYKGDDLNRIAFPIGGMGAGMFCLESTGAISHMSVRHQPNIFNEPCNVCGN